jgi:hypothetical protein
MITSVNLAPPDERTVQTRRTLFRLVPLTLGLLLSGWVATDAAFTWLNGQSNQTSLRELERQATTLETRLEPIQQQAEAVATRQTRLDALTRAAPEPFQVADTIARVSASFDGLSETPPALWVDRIGFEQDVATNMRLLSGLDEDLPIRIPAPWNLQITGQTIDRAYLNRSEVTLTALVDVQLTNSSARRDGPLYDFEATLASPSTVGELGSEEGTP